jgi:TonB family protein
MSCTSSSNSLPFARGNSAERVEAQRPTPPPRGQGPAPEPSIAQRGSAAPQAAEPQQQASNLPPMPESPRPLAPRPAEAQPKAAEAPRPASPGGGSLGQALKNLQQYTQQESFNNPDGNTGQYGPWLQFDSKGVEFGPWVRRFIAQVKRNWFIPYAAMSLKGHVVLQFNVHKNGAITDLTIVQPSNVDAFNNAAFNALRGSNPTHPLPPEYPADKAFFTVTFFYNEQPPSQD